MLEILFSRCAVDIYFQQIVIFFFTGEYILSSGSQNGSGSSVVEKNDPLLNEASLALDNHPLADLTNESLVLNDTLGLEHAFTSELLGGSLLDNAGVEGLLSNDTLGLPEFNLEEALQLVGLDEAQPEAQTEVREISYLEKQVLCLPWVFFNSEVDNCVP